MDQLRTALAWLQRYHFWVLFVVILLIAVVSWKIASGNLAKAFAANQATITGQFTKVQGLRTDPFHPNDDVNNKQAEETKKQAKSVDKLWQQVYERQRDKVLKWPEELNKDFIAEVEKLQFGADIRPSLRTYYQNYVNLHFPALPRIIGARKGEFGLGSEVGPGGRSAIGPEGPGGRISMPSSDQQEDSDYICEWLESDQKIVYDELDMKSQPSKLRIWVTQEDLWVLHTLLDIIKNTNEAANATRMSNAAVKTIAELAVGHRAGKYSRSGNRLLWRPSSAPAGGAPGDAPGSASPEGAGPGASGPRTEFEAGRPSGPGGGGAQNEAQEQIELLYGRYLNAEGKPIPFGAAAAPAEAGAPPDQNTAPQAVDPSAFGLEYKQLPVRMVLRMDQRWLPYLIAQCASQPLQVEVQEVRINPNDAAGLGGEGPGGRASAGPGGGGGSFSFSDEPTQQTFAPHPEIANVIIQGVIYIFNKPKIEILQPPTEQPATTVAGS